MKLDIEVYDPEAWIWWQYDRMYAITWDDRLPQPMWLVSFFGGEEDGVRTWSDVDLPLCWEWA